MTQKHISHPEGLPTCSAGHSARHIHDLRSASADGGHFIECHFIECRCMATRRHASPEAAIADWRRMNRPPRTERKKTQIAVTDNVHQMPLRLIGQQPQRAAGGRHGGR